jgi:hypothetical protein
MSHCRFSSLTPIATRQSQAGQALTEFLVVALAIVPLFLLIPIIAKYQDIGHATQMASRYVAFDATINNPSTNGTKDPAILAQEVRRRFFSNIDAPVKTNDAAGNFKAHQNAFWRGPNSEPLISDINEVKVDLINAGSPSSGPSSFVANNLFGMPSSPMYRGEVSVPLVNLPAGIRSYEPFDQLNLRVDRHTTLLVDGWSARDLDTVRSRVSRMAPAGAALSDATAVLSLPFALIELNQVGPPRIGQLDRWDDVVPADRLRPAR